MSLNLATLNARGQRDPRKCVRLLDELPNQCVDVTAVQETHFSCVENFRVLRDNFDVLSVLGSRCSAGVSLLVGRSLHAIVNVAFAGDGGWLVVSDVAVKSFELRVVAVHAPNSVSERLSVFWRMEPFLDYPKRIILVSCWNAVLDPKMNKARWGASGSDRCESSLIDLMALCDLVDRFLLQGDVDVVR